MRETCGSYPTETESLAEFDRIIGASDLFRVYCEVDGHYVAHRPGRPLKAPRIDRILVPLPRLRQAGWTTVFGVEAKRSGAKLGPLVAQAIDYTWAVYECNSTYLYPDGIFVWPVRKEGIDGESIHCAIESVMQQNRIGHCFSERGDTVQFQFGGNHVLRVSCSGKAEHRHEEFARIGRKVGSR